MTIGDLGKNDLDVLLELAREEGHLRDYTLEGEQVHISFEDGREARIPQEKAVEFITALLHHGQR